MSGALLLIAAGNVAADEGRIVRELVDEAKILSLEAVLERVRQQQYAGRVLEVELEETDGDYRYEIELLTDSGEVVELEVDAVTGRVLEVEGD